MRPTAHQTAPALRPQASHAVISRPMKFGRGGRGGSSSDHTHLTSKGFITSAEVSGKNDMISAGSKT